MTVDLHSYLDIHTHNRMAGPDAIINLSIDDEVPAAGSYSVGIHPWHTANVTDAMLKRLSEMAANNSIVAIGETGIDNMQGADLPAQERVFLYHVALSERLGKPMIIHAVHSINRLVELRRQLRPTQRWILHGFRGKPQQAEQLLRAGFDLSFGEKFNAETIKVVPADRRFAETDNALVPIAKVRRAIGL